MCLPPDALKEVVDLLVHKSKQQNATLMVGLSGLQGSGKSTWASALATDLTKRHGLKVINVSIDDFYHTHDNLVRVREENIDNPLFKTRGQPGTHEETLVSDFFRSISASEGSTKIPSFDKSRYNGEGDRVPVEQWKQVSHDPPIDVLIFEGWCVGFQSIGDEAVEQKWRNSRDHPQVLFTAATTSYATETIGQLTLENLLALDSNLRTYNESFMSPDTFDFFIHLDTDDLQNVYRWRIDQERAMIAAKGQGMSDGAVVAFVRGYMPGYELYLEGLRKAKFGRNGAEGTSLTIVLDADRAIKELRVN